MKPIDKNYLSLQFWNKIHTKNGAEFQSFFEDIMQKAFPDFQKIRPYGKEGDAGNDGYIKKLGAYYQVYAPKTPSVKEADATKKLLGDFEKLKNNWDRIAEIKTYFFVYNDKNSGSTQKLEEAITLLEQNNPGIEFSILNSIQLEKIFFKLDETDILNLGFNVDSRTAISNAYEYLSQVELALDRENGNFAFRIHSQIESVIKSLQDEQLEFEYELLKCRSLQKLERIPGAKDCYQDLSKRYLDDPRPNLYLAELYLLEKEYDQNKLILEQTDQSHWLSKLETLVRKSNLREKIDVSLIDVNTLPENPKIKSNFYRIYAGQIEQSGDYKKADMFIEKAIHLNPDRFSNYETKLELIQGRFLRSPSDTKDLNIKLNKFLKEIENVEKKFMELGEIRDRSKVSLLLMKLNVYRLQERLSEFEGCFKRIFSLILNCYFDLHIENMLIRLLLGLYLPKDYFESLLIYLTQTEVEISDELSQLLIVQFSIQDSLFTDGMEFFTDKNNQKFLLFINYIEEKKYSKTIKYLKDNIPFAIAFADSLSSAPELRKLIIDNLPEDTYVSKDKLLLLYYFDINDLDKAFKIVKRIDLTKLGFVESRTILQVVQKKKAWEMELLLIEKLIKHEKDPKIILNLKLQSFNAYFNLNNFISAINVGEELLAEHAYKNQMQSKNKEALLAHTIQAYLRRGEDERAYELLKKYNHLSTTPDFKISIETEVYLKNDFPKDALNSIVEGTKIKKRLSPEEYASLFFIFTQIENLLKLNQESLESVNNDCFIKLKNQDRWYYISEGEELDATKIEPTNDTYFLFVDKKLEDEIIFKNKYSSKVNVEIIEAILPIEKYIFWQCSRNFEKLSLEGRWDGARMVEVPPQEDTINTQYLETFLQDEQKSREPLFKMYLEKNLPLALLALNEGSLPRAISRITQENKGFVRFSSGILDEMESQKKIASEVITKQQPFIIDGTSALFLSEISFLPKIQNHISNVKVPQSVITMLFEVAEKIRVTAGTEVSMGFAQGKIFFSPIDKENIALIRSNIYSSIKVLESNPGDIISISNANKVDCVSESRMLPELCDACIIAQNENIPILTEDYFYLQMNEMDTKKRSPKYFSSISLLRILYEQNKLGFDDYLQYFGYLSSYRGRFLSLNSDDIFKAVFGDEKIISVKPESIRKLNFALTLSEEYGVPFQSSFNVLATFLLRIIIDDSISISTVEKIYLEILSSLPAEKSTKNFAKLIIEVCANNINKETKIVLSATVQNKINKLLELTNIFNFGKNRAYLF